jgi:hypothetical protein
VEQEHALQQKPPIGKDAFPVTAEAFLTTVEIDLDVVYERLLNETRDRLATLQQQGLTGEALAEQLTAHLQGLSDAPVRELGRASTSDAFNLGRNISAQENLTVIKEAVRTEVLDSNTCRTCLLLDGTIVEVNSKEYFEFMPPNLCEGRDFCRGFYLFRKDANA